MALCPTCVPIPSIADSQPAPAPLVDLSLCPGPNVPLQGRQRSRGCILDAPEESDLISRCGPCPSCPQLLHTGTCQPPSLPRCRQLTSCRPCTHSQRSCSAWRWSSSSGCTPITRCTVCRCPPRRTTTGTTGCLGPTGGDPAEGMHPSLPGVGVAPAGGDPSSVSGGVRMDLSLSPPHPLLCPLFPQSSEEGKRQAAVGPAIERAPCPCLWTKEASLPACHSEPPGCGSGPGPRASGQEGGRDRCKAEAPVVCGGREGVGGGRKRTVSWTGSLSLGPRLSSSPTFQHGNLGGHCSVRNGGQGPTSSEMLIPPETLASLLDEA